MLFLLLGLESFAADHNLPGEAGKFISDRETCKAFAVSLLKAAVRSLSTEYGDRIE